MDIFKLGDKILALLEAVFGFWNNQISLVFAMLGQSPVSFKGGGPWAVIEGIEPVFVAVGSSLVVLFFVIGFCSESIDVKDEMRFESIFRMLIRLGLAEWFVANNVTIMKAFFTSIGNLVGLISAGTTTQLAIDSTQADIIKGLGFGESLVMLILTALLAIIIIICGFFIIYTVYFRFLKILIIVPLGAIACSTMAGNRMVSHTMATYCKYFLSCVFEAVTMALAIVVCNAFINAGLPAFTGSYADWAQTLIYLCEMTFTIAMTVGSVKGAQTLTSKACSGEITMKEIIDQIMMECCKYAYDNSLETHSLDYYMGGATKANDSDRMMYQRVLDYVRNKREIEQIELEKIGINKYDDQIKYRYNIMDKISGHELNKFHFWELQNIHDMHLVKAIVDKRIGKGNFTLDKMQEYSDEYDCFVDSIKKDWYEEHKNSLFDYLAFFTLEWKYSFDFYYEIADALSYMKRRNIKNMRNWIALFSAPLVMYSDLLLSHPGVVPGRVISNNRMLTASVLAH